MKITCRDHTFLIENLPHQSLQLSINEQLIPLQKIETAFVLSIDTLLDIFKKKNHPVKFVDESGTPISFKHLSEPLVIAPNSYIKQGKHSYFIFIDQDDELSLIYNKKPSIMNFYDQDVLFEGITRQDDVLLLKFSFHSKYFEVKQPHCFIKIRHQEQKIALPINRFSVTPVDARRFKTEVEAVIEPKLVEQLLGDRYNYDAFNANIYDLMFGFTIREMPISGFTPRIRHFKNHPELLNDEHWLSLNEQYDVLVRPYSTVSERLAMRLIPVPVETVEYYADPQPLLGLDPNKKTIICFEYPDKAQDNGMIFFKYLVDQHQKRFNIFYIISRSSPDLKNLVGYENHIVFYKSPENIEVVQAADILCHTHSSSYALPFATYHTEALMQTKQKLFLQHGVIGSKDVSHIYGKKMPHPFTDLFVVSSEREKQLIARDYGFHPDEIIVTGLARFDHLITERSRWLKRYKNRKKLLIMPTWRPKLDTYPDEQFMESDYYQEFQALITDERLKGLVMDNKIEVSFYLHRNFQKFSHLFHSDFVDVISQDAFTVKELLENHHVLITDYSSVGLDFSLMHKKVIYYRPPVLVGEDNAGESTDLLPGDVIETRDALMESLRESKMPKKFKRHLSHIYAFDDTKASKRIFEAMQHHFQL